MIGKHMICINNSGYYASKGLVTKGKEYKVINTYRDGDMKLLYTIKSDLGTEENLFATRFKQPSINDYKIY